MATDESRASGEPVGPLGAPPVDTLDQITLELMGELPSLTAGEVAKLADVDIDLVWSFWRSMGFAVVPPETPAFTRQDAASLKKWYQVVRDGVIDEPTMMSLLRAQNYNTERLALWQMEATVEDLTRRHGFDDTAARVIFLDNLPEYAAILSDQLQYAWRRQMRGLAERTAAELAQRQERPTPREVFPLPRALGFVDMVAFTSTARRLESHTLAELVQGFEFTARDVISSNGGRVVKTVGDAVLYVADDVFTAARLSLAMIEAINSNKALLPVRASLVWGRIVSRSGDVFGPAVNLASRLIDIAPRGTVYMDEGTAAMLAKHPRAGDFLQIPRDIESVPGIGEIQPIELRWVSEEAAADVWLPGG